MDGKGKILELRALARLDLDATLKVGEDAVAHVQSPDRSAGFRADADRAPT